MKKQSNSTRSERLVIRISKELLDRVKEKAKENGLSVSSFVRMLLKRETK
ncbi:MAG: ribbon-helix-helix protein, CopG family [Ruminococcus sp.]|nr:ribbon-helix-helix protein, CopG family [Ruminococcus sp.]